VLRAQSKELRLKRRQRARGDRAEDPGEAPVPDDLHVLPALFIIVLGPGAIHIYNQFFA
jgi:tight adherence protein C